MFIFFKMIYDVFVVFFVYNSVFYHTDLINMITAIQKRCCISVSLKLLSREKLESVYIGKWKKKLRKVSLIS